MTVTDTEKTPLARSSHGLSVLGFGTDNPKVVAFGGENQPRIGINSMIHVFEFNNLDQDSIAGTW